MPNLQSPSQTPRNLALQSTDIAIWALALVILCARLIARRLSKAGFWFDDWLISFATVSVACCSIFVVDIQSARFRSRKWTSLAYIYSRSSLRLFALPPPSGVSPSLCSESLSMESFGLTGNSCAIVTQATEPASFIIQVIVADVCWVITLWIVKLSILALYWRLFSARSRSVRVAIWTFAVAVTCWGTILVCPRPSML